MFINERKSKVMLGVTWGKSSHSVSGSCVEARWRKSSRSQGVSNCVECASFRTASYSFSNGQCIEAGSYRTSSHSSHNGGCVDAGHGDGKVGVRDSKQKNIGYPDVLEFTPAQWNKFIGQVKNNTWG